MSPKVVVTAGCPGEISEARLRQSPPARRILKGLLRGARYGVPLPILDSALDSNRGHRHPACDRDRVSARPEDASLQGRLPEG